MHIAGHSKLWQRCIKGIDLVLEAGGVFWRSFDVTKMTTQIFTWRRAKLACCLLLFSIPSISNYIYAILFANVRRGLEWSRRNEWTRLKENNGKHKIGPAMRRVSSEAFCWCSSVQYGLIIYVLFHQVFALWKKNRGTWWKITSNNNSIQFMWNHVQSLAFWDETACRSKSFTQALFVLHLLLYSNVRIWRIWKAQGQPNFKTLKVEVQVNVHRNSKLRRFQVTSLQPFRNCREHWMKVTWEPRMNDSKLHFQNLRFSGFGQSMVT